MRRRKWISLCLLMLMVCLLAGAACAEKRTLAFGYEADIPEGVEITKEEWTPDNPNLIYRMDGTYEDGKEKFMVVWCDSGTRPAINPSARFVDGFNLMSESLWGTLLATSDIGGADIESERYQVMFNQMSTFASQIEHVLSGDGAYQNQVEQTTFKKMTPIVLDEVVNLDEGELNVPLKMRAEYGNEKLVVMDESNRTVLWVRKLPALNIQNYPDADEQMLSGLIQNMQAALEASGLNPNNYDISQETLEANAWKGLRAEYCITAPEKNGEGFATLKEFDSGAQLVVFEGGCSQDEALAMAHSAVIFYLDDTKEEQLIRDGSHLDIGYDNLYTFPVGKNQFVVEGALVGTDTQNVTLECREEELEDGMQTTWGYMDERGYFTEVLTYQYLPMPEAFQSNTLTMSDEEYLTQMENALAYVGGKHLDKLQSVVYMKDGTQWTPELVKSKFAVIMAFIDESAEQLLAESSDVFEFNYEAHFALRDARIVTGYFAPIDKENVSVDRIWNAGGRRWIQTHSFDLFGQDSVNGYAAIALFDGALHLIETPNYHYASGTFRRNDGSVTSAISQKTGAIEEAKASGRQTAIVATKSSPLTLRETPEKSGAKILSIPKGETVFVIQEGDWALIEYNGKQGYVDGKYLK